MGRTGGFCSYVATCLLAYCVPGYRVLGTWHLAPCEIPNYPTRFRSKSKGNYEIHVHIYIYRPFKKPLRERLCLGLPVDMRE